MHKIPSPLSNKSLTKNQDNSAIMNYLALGLVGFGLLFIEQRVLKFFIFPVNFPFPFFELRIYSLIIYFFIFIELARRIKYKIKIGDSFICFALLYIVQFLSYIYNTPSMSFYAYFTNYIFGEPIEIIICILCYLYYSERLVRLLPPFIFLICVINLFFMLTPLEKLAIYRFLAIGARGNQYLQTTVGLYTYPTEAGILGAITVALAFFLESSIFTAIITMIGLFVTILALQRAPFLSLIFSLLPLRFYLKYHLKKAQTTAILLILSGMIFLAYRQLPNYFFDAQNTLFSRLEIGSFDSDNQNTILGAWNARNDMFSSWEKLTLESPFFGNGVDGVDRYMQEANLIGVGHNYFIKSSTKYGIIFFFILIILCIRAFKGFWKVKETKWGISYLAAYLSLFPGLLTHAISPWLLWILLAIGMTTNERNYIKAIWNKQLIE